MFLFREMRNSGRNQKVLTEKSGTTPLCKNQQVEANAVAQHVKKIGRAHV